ncbi:hypothetical protein PtB15_7B220 [Puccinia triticina]|nr:hypothetical protein PtB15_7B220 [Puccinia triticina]
MGIGITADGLKGKNPNEPNDPVDTQGRYKKVVTDYFAVVTPGNEMKWSFLEENKDQYTFDLADEIARYAKDYKKQLRIHTFFAKDQNPKWVGDLKPDDLEKKMNAILEKVISQYGPQAIGADIVNEILDDQGALAKDNPWYKALGDKWLTKVFTHAKQVRDKSAPGMLLFMNDVSTEGINAKSTGMLRIATDLHKAGLLDAVGFQCHFIVNQGDDPTVPKDFKQNLERFTKEGMTCFAGYIQQVRGCVSVTTWGVTPKDSWIGHNNVFPGFGEATLFDNDFKPTPAMEALIQDGFFPKIGGGSGKP